MKKSLKLIACALVLSSGLAIAADAKNEKIEVKDLPAAVTKSVADKWPGSNITVANKRTSGEVVDFRVTVKKDKETYIAVVSPDGKIKKTKEKE